MIEIAIISDIHANIVALEAVLSDIQNKNIDQVYCLGDLVDFAPWGNQVIECIRINRIPCLLGNHDERIAFDKPIVSLPHHSETETSNRLVAINHSKRTITAENKEWLASLPYNIELTYKLGERTWKILLVHASPYSNEQYIYEADDKTEMLDNLRKKSVNAIVMGHTHLSYTQETNEMQFINCGSVGRSKEKDKSATYSILSLNENSINASIVKLDYRLQEVASAIYESEIPDFYADFLIGEL